MNGFREKCVNGRMDGRTGLNLQDPVDAVGGPKRERMTEKEKEDRRAQNQLQHAKARDQMTEEEEKDRRAKDPNRRDQND